jgi:hypothetical protein
LENAVTQISELRQVKNQAAQHQAQTGKALSYEQYCNLLQSAAQTYNGQFVKPATASKPRHVYSHEFEQPRHVYSHEFEPPGEAVDDEEDVFYDIDSDIAVVQANAHQFPRGPSLNGDQWHRLPKAAQTRWDEFSPEDKAIILEAKPSQFATRHRDFGRPSGGRFGGRSGGRFGGRGGRGRPPPRSADLHDISAHDYIANLHEMSLESSLEHSDAPPDMPPEAEYTSPLLAHMTKKKDLAPGDIHRVLSKTMGNKPRAKPVAAEEHVINGSTYRRVDMHKVIYTTSNHRSVRTGALIDRGANGGIAGGETSVLLTKPVVKSMSKVLTTIV